MLRAAGLALLGWVAVEAWAGRVPRPGALALAVLAWLAACALCAFGSVSPHLSLLGEVGQREGLMTALALVGLHLGAAHAHRSERDVRDTLRVVILCAVAAAAYAQLQLAGLDPVPWSGVHTYAVNGAVALRPAGPLGNPILLGAVLAAGLAAAVARLGEPASDAARWVPAAALLAASLVMTLSRGAWLAAALGVAVAAAASLAAGARPRRVAWTLGASLAPALVFGVARASGPLVARLAEGMEGQSASTRTILAHGALRLWSERPWLGVGLDAFGLAYPRVQEPALWRNEWIGFPAHAHSVPLQVLATMGILGALAGLAWLGSAVWELWHAWRARPSARPVLAALAGSFAALGVAGALNVVGLVGAALFAVGTALPGALLDRAPLPRRTRLAPHPLLPAGVAALLCAAALAAGARELAGLAAARPALDVLAPAGATPAEWAALSSARDASLRRATALWPHDDLLWRLACQAALAALPETTAVPADRATLARLDAATAAARRALALVPSRAASYASLGDAFAARAARTGEAAAADSADAAYARASELAPADGWLLVAHARFALSRRDGARALELARRIAGLYPEAAVGHTLMGAALLLLHRGAEAREELLRARAARWEEDAGEQRAAVDRLLEGMETARTPAGRDGRADAPRAVPRR